MAHTFPPFCLISRCLRKIREKTASLVLVTPMRRSQPWYLALLELLINLPLILPENPRLMMDAFGTTPISSSGQLQLTAWKLSGTSGLHQGFQQKLPNCWLLNGTQEPMVHTKVCGNMRVAGVLKVKLIHFHASFSSS